MVKSTRCWGDLTKLSLGNGKCRNVYPRPPHTACAAIAWLVVPNAPVASAAPVPVVTGHHSKYVGTNYLGSTYVWTYHGTFGSVCCILIQSNTKVCDVHSLHTVCPFALYFMDANKDGTSLHMYVSGSYVDILAIGSHCRPMLVQPRKCIPAKEFTPIWYLFSCSSVAL